MARTSFCPSCGGDVADGQRFCGACGAALAPDATGTSGPAETRRWVTVVFADLSGFTRLSEQMDPEDVRVVVDVARVLASMALEIPNRRETARPIGK